VAAGKRALEQFLFQRVYRSERVLAVRLPAQRKLTRLFEWYCGRPGEMPAGFRSRAERFGVRRSVADYIAGMTDRFLDRDHDARLGLG
ncbi:MAG: deoxyguanosinetriphosphate triphosphohydrolase, partial [Planctomycetia bacterium]